MQCESTSTETERSSVSDMHWHVVDRKPPLQARRAKWGQFTVCKKLRDQGYDIIIEVAVPFKNQPIKWNIESQELYNKQLLAADIITYVDTLDMYRTNIPDGCFDRNKLMNRNKYMIDNSDVLIAVWDGSPSGTKHAIDYAKEKNKEVIIINI